jgi:hypothetical protein
MASAEAGGEAVVVYAHPDEFGSEPFQAADLAQSLTDRLRASIISAKTNLWRRRVPQTVRQLLAQFRFGPLGRLAETVRARGEAAPFPGARGGRSA